MNFTLLVTVFLTAIIFVAVVIALSKAISPRSYNKQKMEKVVDAVQGGLLSFCHFVLDV